MFGLNKPKRLVDSSARYYTAKPQEPQAFPGDRELIAVVHCTFGPVNVYMPTMRDMEGMDATHPNFYKAVAAKSIGLSYEKFQEMSFIDGSAIVHKIADALDRLYPVSVG